MFTDNAVAAKYTTGLDGEQVIHMPKYADKRAFRKKLKDLTPDEADALYNRPDKNNILQLKDTVPAANENKNAKASRQEPAQ
ncbi:hypothetical protein ACTJIJ_19910 [Niabella sp. 22666]|uniref:hypothetical protein n=1 Tax=Niabella sp. 22666 TaxID=3453954 RepID=UPI003F87FB32